MSIVPNADLDALMFYELRDEAWYESYEDIGLSEPQAAAIKTAVEAARAAYDAAIAARESSKIATQTMRQNMTVLRTLGGNAIKTIRAFAQSTDDPTVYDTAMIPPPADPTRNTPPAQPTDLRVALNAATGSLKITWKATQPESGTTYVVSRRTGGSGPFAFAGVATGKKSFTDTGIPAGATRVEYLVTGQRGTLTGDPSAVLNVQFGAGGAGFAQIASVSGGQMEEFKMAA